MGNEPDKAPEIWDIYDRDKKKTGRTMQRNVWNLKDDEYHLTVLGLVVHKESGRYLITKRAMDKHWAPGAWEISGGACLSGESSKEAVIREIREETGIDVSSAEGGFCFSYHRENPGKGDNYFVDVYRFIQDFSEKDIRIQSEEATAYMLADRDTVDALGADGKFLHYESIKSIF